MEKFHWQWHQLLRLLTKTNAVSFAAGIFQHDPAVRATAPQLQSSQCSHRIEPLAPTIALSIRVSIYCQPRDSHPFASPSAFTYINVLKYSTVFLSFSLPDDFHHAPLKTTTGHWMLAPCHFPFFPLAQQTLAHVFGLFAPVLTHKVSLAALETDHRDWHRPLRVIALPEWSTFPWVGMRVYVESSRGTRFKWPLARCHCCNGHHSVL